jgi:hypothetical protein
MAREHAAGAKTSEREHLLERLRINPAQHEIGIEPLADLILARSGRFVEAERKVQRLQSVPQRFVVVALPLVLD